jgi:hypothetical protein
MTKRKEPKPEQKPAPGKVPRHYLRPKPEPPKTVQTMAVGETKHIGVDDFEVDTDEQGWINPAAHVADEVDRRHPVAVERVQGRYKVGLVWAHETCLHTWDCTSDPASFSEKGWIAVDEVV